MVCNKQYRILLKLLLEYIGLFQLSEFDTQILDHYNYT